MFFKKVSCVVVMIAAVYASAVSKPKQYIHENIEHLNKLVQKKKSAKVIFSLATLFDEYVDDTKKLLIVLDQQIANDQQDAKKDDIVKQIAHYMAVLQKLLAIMNSNQPEPLEIYCQQQRSDALWGTLCGDRPAKRVGRPDALLKKSEEQKVPEHIKIRYIDANDENLETVIGR
ncbi:MAG: hypothetical protein WCJ92_04075 [Alphaproteobacteria bacterium]